MHYLELVKKTYQEAIALKQMPSDLRTALKYHERMPLMFKNLALELDKLQTSRILKKKKPFAEKIIKDVIYDMVDIFISGVELEAKSRYESDMAKLAAQAEAQKAKDLDATASGNVSGEYQEIFKEGGVTSTDDRSVL